MTHSLESGDDETRLTVLLPVKNHYPEYLNKAVQSVITQSCPLWRLSVIIEEGDREYFQRVLVAELVDKRVELITNAGRKLAGALNTGMKRATTSFVAILLADDMWTNDAVAVLHEHINKFPAVDFFHSSRKYIDESGQPISSVYRSKAQFSVDDFLKSPPVKHLLCWRREKALSIGGMDESLNSVGPDDYDFPWTMTENGAVFQAIDECLYLYREHLDSFRLTTHLPRSLHLQETERIMRKHGADAKAIRSKLSLARKSYLRQCLYRSSFDEWIKRKLRYNLRRIWWRPKYK